MNDLPLPQSIVRNSLHAEIVDRIRTLILEGEIRPGRKISEPDLCERFAISRTPLREALKVLASEGMVELRTNRGAVVRSLSVQELDEVFPIVAVLEGLAAELACTMIRPAELAAILLDHERMVQCWEKSDLAGYSRLNQQIHDAIVAAAGNDTLRRTHRNLSVRLSLIRYTANFSTERWKQAVSEHQEMVELLAARNGPALSEVIRRHYRNKAATVRAWLERVGSASVGAD